MLCRPVGKRKGNTVKAQAPPADGWEGVDGTRHQIPARHRRKLRWVAVAVAVVIGVGLIQHRLASEARAADYVTRACAVTPGLPNVTGAAVTYGEDSAVMEKAKRDSAIAAASDAKWVPLDQGLGTLVGDWTYLVSVMGADTRENDSTAIANHYAELEPTHSRLTLVGQARATVLSQCAIATRAR
jgi:hypothetical protein